ncbi:unnamed protein product [[Candida] boidinii]|uniref:Unnamed protein product n=1 Tax=Candida boidinii TaxID=5477 RepID=A0ACB5TVS9_CANBO|nr:unnamed protein product [[Candida] boidinii]
MGISNVNLYYYYVVKNFESRRAARIARNGGNTTTDTTTTENVNDTNNNNDSSSNISPTNSTNLNRPGITVPGEAHLRQSEPTTNVSSQEYQRRRDSVENNV